MAAHWRRPVWYLQISTPGARQVARALQFLVCFGIANWPRRSSRAWKPRAQPPFSPPAFRSLTLDQWPAPLSISDAPPSPSLCPTHELLRENRSPWGCSSIYLVRELRARRSSFPKARLRELRWPDVLDRNFSLSSSNSHTFARARGAAASSGQYLSTCTEIARDLAGSSPAFCLSSFLS